MEKRKDIDMLRFYGGDIHQKNKEGEYVITNNLVNPKIANVTNDEHIKQSNQYYTEKYGKLTEKAVRENLLEISYGETPFTSLYTGKLSHDDLLMFASKLIKRYPVLLKKIGDKYNYIFIDEYQDTEIEGILTAYKLFYVGCSRARKNLIIMVEKNKIINFKEKFVDKIKKIGFTVLS